MTIVPRYGVDYKSKKAVQEAFDGEKDFIVADISSPWNGKAVNKRDLAMDGQYATVNVRYKGLAQIAVLRVRP